MERMEGQEQVAEISQEELNKEHNQVIRELFQQAYKSIYSGGSLEELIGKLEEGADPAKAIPMLLTTVMNDMIQNGGVTNVTILFNVGVLLAADIAQTLSEIGMQITPEQMQQIVANTIQGVLLENEEMAKTVMTNPQMQQMLKQQQQASPQQPTPQAPSESEAGVMGGAM